MIKCYACDLGYFPDANDDISCLCNKLKEQKINLLACPENCDRCQSANTCDQCNSKHPYFDQTQNKCFGK